MFAVTIKARRGIFIYRGIFIKQGSCPQLAAILRCHISEEASVIKSVTWPTRFIGRLGRGRVRKEHCSLKCNTLMLLFLLKGFRRCRLGLQVQPVCPWLEAHGSARQGPISNQWTSKKPSKRKRWRGPSRNPLDPVNSHPVRSPAWSPQKRRRR